MLVRTALFILYYLMLVGISLFASVRGRAPERIGAAILFGASTLTLVEIPPMQLRWRTVDLPTFAIDVAVTVAFYALAVKSTRFWPVWCLGFAMANLLTHFARMAVENELPLAYATGSTAWAYLTMVSLAVGTGFEAGEPPPGPRLADRAIAAARRYLG